MRGPISSAELDCAVRKVVPEGMFIDAVEAFMLGPDVVEVKARVGGINTWFTGVVNRCEWERKT